MSAIDGFENYHGGYGNRNLEPQMFLITRKIKDKTTCML